MRVTETREAVKRQLEGLSDDDLKARLTQKLIEDFDLRRRTEGKQNNSPILDMIDQEMNRRGHPGWYGEAVVASRGTLKERRRLAEEATAELARVTTAPAVAPVTQQPTPMVTQSDAATFFEMTKGGQA